jgi:hypothetical protein
MQLYTGFDLHSSNSYVGIIDENGKRAFNGEPALGLAKPRDLIGNPSHPLQDNVISIFTAHAVSHLGAG